MESLDLQNFLMHSLLRIIIYNLILTKEGQTYIDLYVIFQEIIALTLIQDMNLRMFGKLTSK